MRASIRRSGTIAAPRLRSSAPRGYCTSPSVGGFRMRKPARPNLRGTGVRHRRHGDAKLERLTVYIPAGLLRRIASKAQRQGLSVSLTVTRLLEESFERNRSQ